jgi:neutral ceramidase
LGIHLAGSFEVRPAEDVHDPLYAKAVVLSDGDTRLALVLLDLIMLPREDVEAIRAKTADRSAIPPEQVMIACTHTHTGPAPRTTPIVRRDDAYFAWLTGRVADCVTLAARRLRPARLAWGAGEQHDISYCRRYRMRDGSVRMHPRTKDPDIVEPASPIDPQVSVLYIEDVHECPLAVIARFSMHYVGTDNSRAISADYYGHFANVMRRHFGAGFVPLLFNGTSGQIASRSAFRADYDRGHAKAKRVAQALAGEVIKVVAGLRPQTNCSLKSASTRVALTRKPITDEDIRIAKQILAGANPSPDAGPFSYVVGQPIPQRLRQHFAEHVLLVADMPEKIMGEVQVFRVGDSAWVGLPGEIFVEIGLAIRAESPAPHTFVIGLANDALGYIPTDKALQEEGGYETWARTGAPIGTGAEGLLIGAAGDLLRKLFA